MYKNQRICSSPTNQKVNISNNEWLTHEKTGDGIFSNSRGV